MTAPTPTALDDLHRLDRDHCWHPLYQHQQLADGQTQLTIFERGEGSTLYDAEGRAYLDGYGGLWNVNVGYGRQEISEAVFEQLKRLPYYPHSQINEPATRLAARLAELTPGDLRHTFFSNSGSEANETAFKIARQYGQQRFPSQRRYKILSRYRGYHGFTFGAMSATGQMARRTKFEPLVPGFLHVDPPYCYRCPLHLSYPSCRTACVEEFDEVIRREGPETVAAIVVEPIIGGGGVIPSPDGYLQRLREICDEHQVLLIFDEVITGWGRTGRLFGCEHEGVEPDIMVMAKGITSGYQPLGATIVTDEVFDAFSGETADRREFAQVCTYGGHPAACAAALANIDILTSERLWENAELVGGQLLAGLSQLSSPLIGEIRGRGLMIAIELIEQDGSLLNVARTNAIKASMKEQGILVGQMSHVLQAPESILFLAPPLILTGAEAQRIVDAFAVALSD